MSHGNPRWLWLAVAVSIVISGLAFMNALDGKSQQVDSAVGQAKDERKDKEAVVSDASTLAQQVTIACATSKGKTLAELKSAGLCKQAEETKDTIDEATDETTPAPVVGPSQAQVNTAVRALLFGVDLSGPRGPAPTAEQIANAVAEYCADRAECRGEQGATGGIGGNGADGAPGADGAAGKDAPVIVSSFCDEADHIVLVFDSGVQVVVSESDCRVDVLEP